jgi:hypothetical protein
MKMIDVDVLKERALKDPGIKAEYDRLDPVYATGRSSVAASEAPPAHPSVPWRVTSVAPLSGYRIAVYFFDGITGVVHMKARVRSPKAGVFAALQDPAIFNQVHVELGVVTWPGEVDLAPDAMYAELAAHGEWHLPE